MALSAGEAQSKYANDGALSANFKTTTKVNVLPKLKIKDFVLINWDGRTKLAKILDIIDDKVHVRWYLQKSQLPNNCRTNEVNGEPIELDDNYEVIEDVTASRNVEKKLICCKCHVYYANASDSIAAVLASHELHEKYDKMYVCRFKLVKKTVYKLEPVSWSREETNSDYESVGDDTCTEDEHEADLHKLLRTIGKKNIETKHIEADENRSKLVSPIKIVNGASVQKVKRQKNNEVEEKIDDANVSPSKRQKIANERNGNYLTESPKSSSQTRSYHPGKVRKNLNTSFSDASFDTDNNDTIGRMESYSVDPVDSNQTLKMKIRKNSATPLKELHDNVTDTPTRNLRKQVLNKTLQAEYEPNATPSATRRTSILKSGSASGRSVGTPKRNVVIKEEITKKMGSDSIEPIVATPSKMQTRRSTRLSSVTAREKIHVMLEDQSPEMVKAPPKRPNTPKTPKTPKLKTVQDEYETNRSGRRSSVVPKTPTNELTPQRTRQLFRAGNLTPSIQSRESALSSEQNGLEMIRERLHVSAVPDSLPCRETEFQNIHSFVKDKINDECGGCIYIAGVPGTGKTATVTQVVRKLQIEAKRNVIPKFDYVEINGMRLTEPRQAYVQIYRQLTGKTLAWAQARDLLEKRFTDSKSMSKKQTRSTILLIDELDIICNRKQDVVYNLFDWTSKQGSRLVAITIANTMDLPERVLKLKVASRLGLTRITFQPYTFKQLQEVVMARLTGSNHFVSDAVQLVARKVASVSGDCRRALDICRRATEIAEEVNAKDLKVNFAHVNQALNEMFASPRVRAIKCCTRNEKLFLQAVASEIERTGIEEVDFLGVFTQLQILAPVLGIKNPPNQSLAMDISLALGASRLLIVEDSQTDIYQKIILNMSVEDLHYALNCQQ